MARRDRDRDDRREESGGVRRTQAVRTVERAIADRRPTSVSTFDLDLSAFGPSVGEPDRNRASIASPQSLAQPSRQTALRSRNQTVADSKRGAQRREERELDRKTLKRPLEVKKQVAAQRTKTVASRDHLHEVRPARKESTRQKNSCKERPTKTKGSGGSRKFVPWCNRRT